MQLNTHTIVNDAYLPITNTLTHGYDLGVARNTAFSSNFLEDERNGTQPYGQARILEPREIERVFKHVAGRCRLR